MLTVELLPARYGDALLVTWGLESRPHRMLIDGGLASAYSSVAKRLRSLPGVIDLFVVSHIDRDHIGGVVKLLENDSLASRFGAVWFNGRDHVEQFSDLLGVLDGERLSDLITRRGIPWNSGWPEPVSHQVGGAVVVRDQPPAVNLSGGATVTLLSPTPAAMRDLWPVWKRVIDKAGLSPGTPASAEPVEEAPRAFLGAPPLHDLADRPSDPDTAEANGSSIAFVFSYDGQSILFGADAHAKVLLESLAQITPTGDKYPLTACKLPHHGSRRNVSTNLVRALDCSQWWFSTNGVRFLHPNPEAIARVLVYGDRPPVLCANYRTSQWDSFVRDYPPADHQYELRQPVPGAEGLLITLS